MSVIRDIAATYAGPHKVVDRHLAIGEREDRALVLVMAACLLFFVSSWPINARIAHLEGRELNPLLGGALMGWIFIAPLAFYTLSFVVGLVLSALGWKGGTYGSRIALFWALLASSPLVLIHGLVLGFAGPGMAQQAIGLIWVLVFFWFWSSGLMQAGRSAK
ncbi:hypothetical protein PH7735_01645 [Shimia thalassica]|uniref:Yip1 domain protein n=1 Tax=Shimia thalassica TaxID=1715693 RepID=A0A0P1I6S7_9RHOB|nr:hypothetical protein [Shimia thalassica]CUJ93627.1 hypothetical protein PH7735_01645 [Shimia thalassica]